MECKDVDKISLKLNVKYFKRCIKILPCDVASYDTSRMTILFFALSGLDVMDALDEISEEEKKDIITWIYAQQSTSKDGEDYGGFRGSPCFLGVDGADSVDRLNSCHLTMTYTALATLLILGDDLSRVERRAALRVVGSMQCRDGSFQSHCLGSESDLRFVYCAAAICYMLDDLTAVDGPRAAAYIYSCLSPTGGFGQGPLREGHGGLTYCAVATLSLLGYLPRGGQGPPLRKGVGPGPPPRAVGGQGTTNGHKDKLGANDHNQKSPNASVKCSGKYTQAKARSPARNTRASTASKTQTGCAGGKVLTKETPCDKNSLDKTCGELRSRKNVVGEDRGTTTASDGTSSSATTTNTDTSTTTTNDNICLKASNTTTTTTTNEGPEACDRRLHELQDGSKPSLYLTSADVDDLTRWLLMRLCDLKDAATYDVQRGVRDEGPGGGICGRVNKPADSCYTYWVGAALTLLGAGHLPRPAPIVTFVAACQSDSSCGGFSKYAGEPSDLLHSYLATAGLAALGLHPGLSPVHPGLNVTYRAARRLRKV